MEIPHKKERVIHWNKEVYCYHQFYTVGCALWHSWHLYIISPYCRAINCSVIWSLCFSYGCILPHGNQHGTIENAKDFKTALYKNMAFHKTVTPWTKGGDLFHGCLYINNHDTLVTAGIPYSSGV